MLVNSQVMRVGEWGTTCWLHVAAIPALACRRAHPSQQPRPNTPTHPNFTAELERANLIFIAGVI